MLRIRSSEKKNQPRFLSSSFGTFKVKYLSEETKPLFGQVDSAS